MELKWKNLNEKEKRYVIEHISEDQIIDWFISRCQRPCTIPWGTSIDYYEEVFKVFVPPTTFDFEHSLENCINYVTITVVNCFDILKEKRRLSMENQV